MRCFDKFNSAPIFGTAGGDEEFKNCRVYARPRGLGQFRQAPANVTADVIEAG